METTLNQSFTTSSAAKKTLSFDLTSFWDTLERDRFGMTPLFLVLAACLGGFAAAVSLKYSLLMLSIVGLTTGMVEVLLIAVAPMRVIFWFLVVAVMVDLMVFIF